MISELAYGTQQETAETNTKIFLTTPSQCSTGQWGTMALSGMGGKLESGVFVEMAMPLFSRDCGHSLLRARATCAPPTHGRP